jgi:phospholipid/cholesterol/gamma-HCH transport system substrate-binding protein
MEAKREQALVGLFVLIAAGLLIVVVFLLSGTMTQGDTPYKAYFKNAGGLAPGSEVHYAGGPPIGRVKSVRPDPKDATRMEVEFAVHPDTPVKTDTMATITSVSPLGDNFLGLIPGSASAPRAPRDSTLPSKEFTSLGDLTDQLAQLGTPATQLLNNLNARVTTLQETLTRVNALLDDENRRNIAGTVAELHGMLKEDRPLVHTTLTNVNASIEKLQPLIASFQKTSAQADQTLAHVDAILGENRQDLHASIVNLRDALSSASDIMGQLNSTTAANTENLDEIIENMRIITDNLNSFTETIKTRPYTLIRASGVKQHKPGEAPPQ